jgi:hypothetical protein
MGLDPMAAAGSPAFRNAENMLELGEMAGLGTRRLEEIEVTGEPISSVVCPFPPLGGPTSI